MFLNNQRPFLMLVSMTSKEWFEFIDDFSTSGCRGVKDKDFVLFQEGNILRCRFGPFCVQRCSFLAKAFGKTGVEVSSSEFRLRMQSGAYSCQNWAYGNCSHYDLDIYARN